MSTQAVEIVTTELQSQLAHLRASVEALVVADQQGYVLACELVKQGRGYIKSVGFRLDPGIESARKHLEFLRGEKEKYVSPAKEIVSIAEVKAEIWKSEERRKAAAEQERINAQRRAEAAQKAELERKQAEAEAKLERERREAELAAARKAGEIGKREEARLAKQAAADEAAAKELAAKQAAELAANVQEVTVKPSVPTVAGIRARVNYRFEVLEPSAVNRAFLKPDEVAIGQRVRADKDPEKSMREIGGIRVWQEDSI